MKHGKLLAFPGQITIAEYLERVEAAAKETAEDYLSKGERLTTLARQRFEKMMDKLSFSDLEKKIFSTKIPEFADPQRFVDILSKSVVRPLVKAMTTFDESDEAYMSLKGVVDFDFTLKRADEGMSWQGAYRYLTHFQKKTDDILLLTIREEGYPDVSVMGYRAHAMNKKKCDVLWKDGSAAADIGTVLSWLLVLTLYNRAMADEDMEGELLDAFSDLIKPTSHMKLASDVKQDVLRASGIDFREYAFIPGTPCYLPVQKYLNVSETVSQRFTEVTGCEIVGHTDYPDDIFINRNRESLANISNPKPYGYMVKPGIEWRLLYGDPANAFKAGIGKAVYNALLVRSSPEETDTIPRAWAVPRLYRATGNDCFTIILQRVLHALWRKKGVVAQVWEYYDSLRKEGTRSKVYQTKKNIPAKVLKDMEESSLNEHFGYVEFDESCDLDKMKIVSGEFEAFRERHLPALDVSQVAIRFRLLGNYKAAGLFFPNINCLCVDVRHPSSFIHELGHAIDYLNDRLSEKKAFKACYNSYRTALIAGLSQAQYRELKTTKRKFNLDYYLLPTEVFARCLEMYVTRILGVDLSICSVESEMGWAYPVSEDLRDCLTGYFGDLFKSYQAENETAA